MHKEKQSWMTTAHWHEEGSHCPKPFHGFCLGVVVVIANNICRHGLHASCWRWKLYKNVFVTTQNKSSCYTRSPKYLHHDSVRSYPKTFMGGYCWKWKVPTSVQMSRFDLFQLSLVSAAFMMFFFESLQLWYRESWYGKILLVGTTALHLHTYTNC